MPSTHETLQTALGPDARLRPAEDTSPALPAGIDEIATELERMHRAVSVLVARIDDAGTDPDLLDELTEQIVTVLARVEQLRCARAWWRATQRRDEERWVDYLDVA